MSSGRSVERPQDDEPRYNRGEEVNPMTTITLTPELGEAVEQAVERSGGQPVRVEDPRNHRIYFLHISDLHLRPASPDKAQQTPVFDIPEEAAPFAGRVPPRSPRVAER